MPLVMDSKRGCVRFLNNRITELTIIPTIMKQLNPLHYMLPFLTLLPAVRISTALAALGLLAGTGVSRASEEHNQPQSKVELFLAPDGRDTNSDTKSQPFATLGRARAAVRKMKETSKLPITVYLRGGTYYLYEPLVFTAEDSGSRNAPVQFAAFEKEKPVLSLVFQYQGRAGGVQQHREEGTGVVR